MNLNYAIDILGLTVIIVLIVSERKNKITGSNDQKLFRLLLGVIAIVFIFDIPAWMLDGVNNKVAKPINLFCNTCYYLAQIVYCMLWITFADCWCNCDSDNWKKRFKWYAIPGVIEIILIITNLFTGWIFTLSDENVYSRGVLYAYNLIPYILYILGAVAIAIGCYFFYKKGAQKKQCLLFAVYMVLPIIGTAMQMLNYGVSLLWPFTVMSLIMVYLNIQQQTLMQNSIIAAQMEQELTNAKMSIMLSQIQPHFLYNVLCVIQDLCHDKAPEAEETTIEFANFLRCNMDSLGSKKDILFEKELNHTKNYLSLEKKRFGELLNVIYDIKVTDFSLPPLTLQPIVENAVRYGVMQKEEGGTVWISTIEDNNKFIITVKDDGAGFDIYEKKKDGRTHIGICNVKERLERMCGGELEILSNRGVGTTAKIIIPKEV